MCPHIFSKADALVDLSMGLKKLEDGVVACLSETTCMLFQEIMEVLLLVSNFFFCFFCLFGRGN
jgi:hypothetical protein